METGTANVGKGPAECIRIWKKGNEQTEHIHLNNIRETKIFSKCSTETTKCWEGRTLLALHPNINSCASKKTTQERKLLSKNKQKPNL